jgi:hypothetical protein
MAARTVAALAARAVATLGEDASPLDYVCFYLAGGQTLNDLAAELTTELGTPVSRQHVSQTAHELEPAAKERIAAARTESAFAFAEATKDIADQAEPTAGGAAKARLQIGSRQWLAERFNAELFGTRPANINVNIGALMLDALRQPMPPPLHATATPILLEGSFESTD